MERRGTRTQYKSYSTQDAPRGEQIEFFGINSKKWVQYVRRAADKGLTFTTVFNLFDEYTLLDALKLLDGSKATGVDNVTKRDFALEADKNVKVLMRDLKTGKYRPLPKREILIPKANGKTRPIAIGCVRDKIVETVTAKILNLMYEPIFIRNSYGFRPLKSAHKAIEASYMILKDNKRPWVVEIDFESFFNTVPHKSLLRIIEKRTNDSRLLKLLKLFLKSKIVSLGKETWPTVGTPQGSVVSPILSNIYLHEVIDEWFNKNYASQKAQMVRYADDAIFMFSTKEEAEDFMKSLDERVLEYGLRLNKEKTSLTDFREESGNKFSFLGFSFIWGKRASKTRSGLKVQTQKEKLHRKSQDFKEWIKANRNVLKAQEILKITSAKLRGHYRYYGYKCNRAKLVHFYWLITNHLYKWMNRRSQKKSYNGKQFSDFIKKLPRPPEMYLLHPLGVRNVI